jgi:hypothetical protein
MSMNAGSLRSIFKRCVGMAHLGLLVLLLLASHARANEVMTDRCGGDVAFPPQYDQGPNAIGTKILTRAGGRSIQWSLPFHVVTDGDSHIRWWCHSTTGNWFDAGTWRIDSGQVGSKCTEDGCTPTADLSVDPPDSADGWTAERSRCDSHSSVIRARLDQDRLLQIECLPSDTGTARSAVTLEDCSSGIHTCIQGFVWREAVPYDFVCVDPTVRAQAKSDNAAAVGRRSPTGGPSGPDTCVPGFVWREADHSDHVCVTTQIRSQAAFDNSRYAERKACREPAHMGKTKEPPSGTFPTTTPDAVLRQKRALYALSTDEPLIAPAEAAIDVQLTFKPCQLRLAGCPVTPDLEQWSYDPSTHRLYHAASGKCVNISGARHDAGSPIILYPCSGVANEKWTVLERAGSPIWSFKSDLTGMCLHALPGHSSNRLLTTASTLVQMPCDGSEAQRFDNVDSGWSARNGPH